ncbi:hypothetical protein RvY_01547 [Ramazzottius varieornatus]|uniref:Uncharacterized protein n=1 Tax=Ramazzottius varieornatus TaxID=947166 RepID=A0A1D1UH08_RAMVA|nr:hypothetical protein RvY_01547 [Ramazzottius varieornatus]
MLSVIYDGGDGLDGDGRRKHDSGWRHFTLWADCFSTPDSSQRKRAKWNDSSCSKKISSCSTQYKLNFTRFSASFKVAIFYTSWNRKAEHFRGRNSPAPTRRSPSVRSSSETQ